jgi:hypothetical protein
MRPMRARSTRRTVLALVPWVLGGSVLAVGGLFVTRALVSAERLKPSNDSVGNFMQTLGGIYAVLLAFVVFVVWQQFNETRAQIESEANEVLDLLRTTQGLPFAARVPIQKHLTLYVDDVIGEEWIAMGHRDEAVFERVALRLDDVWDVLQCFEPNSGCEEALHQEALTRFNDLSDARSLRLTSSRARIPNALRLILYIGAVILVASTWLLGVDSFAIHAFISGGLAGSVTHVIYVIEDLDDCFAGDWQVSRASFERVRSYLRDHAAASIESA